MLKTFVIQTSLVCVVNSSFKGFNLYQTHLVRHNVIFHWYILLETKGIKE